MKDLNAQLPEYRLWHIAFYKFVSLKDPQACATRLREISHAVQGAILVASEGVNGMVAGTEIQINAFEAAMRAELSGAFADMIFKRTKCKTQPFNYMVVRCKREIVPMGIDGIDASDTGTNLSPIQWRELLQRDDVVLLDNRNSFEYRLGHFKTAIDPGVQNFRDFPRYVQENWQQWKADGKKVAMYCTGGIRCEKTSAWMQQFDLDVYQLEGGILNYFKQMPDAEQEWQGECFVFDSRIALNTKLEETPTTAEDVYKAEPDGEWRLNRALRLAGEKGSTVEKDDQSETSAAQFEMKLKTK